MKCSIIVLLKSLRHCKGRNKGNFMLKSNSNKIMLCGGQHYLILKTKKYLVLIDDRRKT